MTKLLRRGESALVLGLALLMATTVARAESVAESDRCDQDAVTPLLAEIRTRDALLDQREREIEERERTHGELESVVEERLAEIERIRGIIEHRIAAWEEQNGDRIRRLAKIYSAMPPQRAAPLVEALDVGLATRILNRMKHKDSAAVLALLSHERALSVSRHVAHPLGFEPRDTGEGGS